MATLSGWTFSSVGKCTTSGAPKGSRTEGNTFRRATETLTWANSNAGDQDITGTVIDFIPAGSDFLVICNTGATNTSSDADLAVYACGTRGGTYALLKDDLLTTIDSAVKPVLYDTSANGEAPYYKFFIDSDGVQKKTDTITIDVYWTEV